MSFWKIVVISMLVAILLATAHMEIKNRFHQVNDPKHYDTIGN
ncbi:MAG: hypothetical protein ACOY30_02610 [Bacillota bacterium]